MTEATHIAEAADLADRMQSILDHARIEGERTATEFTASIERLAAHRIDLSEPKTAE